MNYEKHLYDSYYNLTWHFHLECDSCVVFFIEASQPVGFTVHLKS